MSSMWRRGASQKRGHSQRRESDDSSVPLFFRCNLRGRGDGSGDAETIRPVKRVRAMRGITQEEYEKERRSIILKYLSSDLPEDERKLVIKEELASLRKSIY